MHGPPITEEKKSAVRAGLAVFSERSVDPDVVRCAEYLLMREVGYSVQEIAEEWDYKDRGSVYKLLAKWRQTGALKEAEELFLLPKVEEINAATSHFMQMWPQALAKLERIILNGRDKVALEAIAWAKTNIVDPEMNKQEEAGAAESAYARKSAPRDPTMITMPSFLKPKDG